jgi:hypothetical protein
MVIDSKNTLKNLRKKGFSDAPGDHYFLEFFHNGKLIVRTKISHGGAHDISDSLISKMASQCKLTKQEFYNLATCPLSQNEYIQKLIDAKYIENTDN